MKCTVTIIFAEKDLNRMNQKQNNIKYAKANHYGKFKMETKCEIFHNKKY